MKELSSRFLSNLKAKFSISRCKIAPHLRLCKRVQRHFLDGEYLHVVSKFYMSEVYKDTDTVLWSFCFDADVFYENSQLSVEIACSQGLYFSPLWNSDDSFPSFLFSNAINKIQKILYFFNSSLVLMGCLFKTRGPLCYWNWKYTICITAHHQTPACTEKNKDVYLYNYI